MAAWPFPNFCSLGPHCSMKFEGVANSYKQFSHHKVNQTSEELMHNYMVVHCDAIPQESSQSVNPSRWCGCFCWWLMQMAAASLASLTVFLRCFLCDIGPEDTMTCLYTKLKLGFVNLCFGCGHLSKICFTRVSQNTTTTWPLFFHFWIDRLIGREVTEVTKDWPCGAESHRRFQGVLQLVMLRVLRYLCQDLFLGVSLLKKDFPWLACRANSFCSLSHSLEPSALTSHEKTSGIDDDEQKKNTCLPAHVPKMAWWFAIDHPKKGFNGCFSHISCWWCWGVAFVANKATARLPPDFSGQKGFLKGKVACNRVSVS